MLKKTYYINWNISDSENYSHIYEQLPMQVIADSFQEAVSIASDFQNKVSSATYVGISEGGPIFIKD